MELYQNIAEAVFALLKEKYSSSLFTLWFKELEIEHMNEHKVVVSTISSFKQKILTEHYMDPLSDAFLQVLGFPVQIEITSRDVSLEEQRRRMQQEPDKDEEEEERAAQRDKEIMTRNIEGKDPVLGYTFDNFIVGDSNRFAHAACWAVAQSFTTDEEILTNPLEDKYNPLFIYGPSGNGKTHLLYAITNEIKQRTPGVKLIYIRGEDFVNEMVESMQRKTMPAFRNKYRNTDVLLIDDIHFIAGKEGMQEEFFNTFNSLYDADKQIILTSDRPPCEIKNLTNRLRNRFEWGITADIQPPTPELRAAIIKMKAQKYGIELSDDIVYYMADKIKDNIRTIEGAIKKLNVMQILTHTPITLELVKRTLADVQSGTGESSFLIDKIFRVVSKHYDVPIDTLKSPRRQQNVVYARQVCMYLLRTLTDSPLSEIGSFFNRDHSTVINAVNKVEKMMEEDPKVKDEIDTLTEQVKK